MDPIGLSKFLLPRLPLLLKTILLNCLRISANCDKQDVRTETVVALIRSAIVVKDSVGVMQAKGLKDPGIKGRMWISTASIPAPDTRIRDLVLLGIKALGDGTEQFDLPDVSDVEGEWTGFRDGVDKKAPRPDITEAQQYENLMKEVSSDVTILYFHGGAYFLMDPSSHRMVTSALAKKTKGRCFSVRYRLAPQHPFPSQLLDALISYLYLLSPPEGSFHEPVKARNIVFAGDSAGGNLSFALALLLLTLKKSGVTSLPFHGKDVPLELPAGISGNSPWLDVSRSMPSVTHNAKYDYIDPPSETGFLKTPPPADEIWPSKPPRAEMFCQAACLDHPLVSPLMATVEMWQGLPPVFMCTGSEGLEDEIVTTARRIYKTGTFIDFVGFEGQPHCFAMIFPTTVPGRECMTRWAQFCTNAVNGDVEQQETAKWMKAFSSPPSFLEVDMGSMGVSDDDVRAQVERMKMLGLEREREAIQALERSSKAKL